MTKTADTTSEAVNQLHGILNGDEGYEVGGDESYTLRRAAAVQRLSEIATATGITASDLITELMRFHHDDAMDGREHWSDTWALLEKAQRVVDDGGSLTDLLDEH